MLVFLKIEKNFFLLTTAKLVIKKSNFISQRVFKSLLTKKRGYNHTSLIFNMSNTCPVSDPRINRQRDRDRDRDRERRPAASSGQNRAHMMETNRGQDHIRDRSRHVRPTHHDEEELPDYQSSSDEAAAVPAATSSPCPLTRTQKRNQRKKLLRQRQADSGDRPVPYVIPATINPLVNLDVYVDVDCSQQKFGIENISFPVARSVPFHADPRLRRVQLVLPKKDGSVSPLPQSVAVTATYYGGSCSTCRIGSKAHAVNDQPRLFLIGDELCPLVVGEDTACCPAIRVHSGDFDQCYDILKMQRRAGFRPKTGSVLLVLLHTHLRRVGHVDYWREFP